MMVADAREAFGSMGEADVEALEERAAICEYDGGLPRCAAEEFAVIEFDAWKRGHSN